MNKHRDSEIFNYIVDNFFEFEMLKKEIYTNPYLLINFFLCEENSREILTNLKKSYVTLEIINLYVNKGILKQDNLEHLMNLSYVYITPQAYEDYYNLTSNILRQIFNFINNSDRYEMGYNFFNTFSNLNESNKFTNAKAYALYFAYQDKSFYAIKDILNAYHIEFRSRNYDESYDFCMMNFYKGLIHLSQHVI